jgi:hypothetical protein
MRATLGKRVARPVAGTTLAVVTVLLLGSCGGATDGPTSPAGGTTATPGTVPSPSVIPTTQPAAQPTCPLTQAQVDQAFGQTLPGPQAPLNAYEVCVFGQAAPGNYHVVTVSVYNAATLAGFGSSASSYLESNRGPTAVTVPNVGVAAFIKGGDIWVETPDQAILDIGADFVVTHAALQAAATAALPQV